MRNIHVYLLHSENKLAYLLTFLNLLFSVKSSETKRDFHQELLTTACPFCIFAFESGLKVANQQPCRKVCTVILHCNFKNAVTMSTFLNKGQRMPNIFERARAYDNWNEGNFQPQEDGLT